MYKYKVKLFICWKNLSTSYETITIESTDSLDDPDITEDDYNFYIQAIITDYEASLPYELLENIGYVDIVEIEFLGVK
jgi:hypothetical protein